MESTPANICYGHLKCVATAVAGHLLDIKQNADWQWSGKVVYVGTPVSEYGPLRDNLQMFTLGLGLEAILLEKGRYACAVGALMSLKEGAALALPPRKVRLTRLILTELASKKNKEKPVRLDGCFYLSAAVWHHADLAEVVLAGDYHVGADADESAVAEHWAVAAPDAAGEAVERCEVAAPDAAGGVEAELDGAAEIHAAPVDDVHNDYQVVRSGESFVGDGDQPTVRDSQAAGRAVELLGCHGARDRPVVDYV